MRIINCICFLPVILILSACSQKKQNGSNIDSLSATTSAIISADTIAYTKETLRAEDTLKKDDQGNFNYTELRYPDFANLPVLNARIEKLLFGAIGENETTSERIKTYFTEYKKNFAEPIDSAEIQSFRANTLDMDITIMLQVKKLLVIRAIEETSGGMHPNTYITYLNWDSITDKPIGLNEIMIDNYKPALNKIAELQFKKDNKLAPNYKFEDYNFKDGKFALNNNFEITREGLLFFYNSYEIQGYASGPELLLPYQLIKHLLRPNTVVSQFIK